MISVSFQVVGSSLLHVVVILLLKMSHQVQIMIPVITIAQVAPFAIHVILKVLGLLVVKPVG